MSQCKIGDPFGSHNNRAWIHDPGVPHSKIIHWIYDPSGSPDKFVKVSLSSHNIPDPDPSNQIPISFAGIIAQICLQARMYLLYTDPWPQTQINTVVPSFMVQCQTWGTRLGSCTSARYRHLPQSMWQHCTHVPHVRRACSARRRAWRTAGQSREGQVLRS